MPVYDLYSKRKRRAERANEPDVFDYDVLPQKLRTQVRQLFTAAIGPYRDYGEFSTPRNNNDAWETISGILRRELGVDSLVNYRANPQDEVLQYIVDADTDDALSAIEICANWIERIMAKKPPYDLEHLGATQNSKDALEELNHRFRESSVGYEFVSGEIVRVDSKFVHAEVVRPALALLRDPRFKGAEEEFLGAHAHFRSGKTKEAVTAANSAFESVMKSICDLKGWQYPAGARASDLVKVLRKNGLLPDYLDNSFDQLVATLGSGLPQVRNNDGGHGQGSVPRPTPDYVAAYALHLCATNIVFLVSAAQS